MKIEAKLRHRWDALSSSFWFIPTLMVLCAILMAVGMIILDAKIDRETNSRLGVLYDVSPEGARTILTMIAQSLITVTSIAFSITIVVLTLASSQFGPRLLRNFMVDTGNQIVLGTFIATFVYCLLVLRIITSTKDVSFVPSLSVSFAVILAVINVGVLIYFIHHIAISIQADHIVTSVRNDLEKQIDKMFPKKWQGLYPEHVHNAVPDIEEWFDKGHDIIATKSGYLQVTDKESLLEISSKNNFIIKLRSSPGDFIIAGTALMTIKGLEDPDDKVIIEKLIHCFFLGSQRTPEQDPEFAIRQLVEIAIRALSPSLNDPFTAMICIDQLSATLCQLTQRRFPSPFSYDDKGNLRLIEKPLTFSTLIKEAFDQIRLYGRTSLAVTLRLLGALTAMAKQAHTTEQREAVLRQATMIERVSQTELPEENDRKDVQRSYQELLSVMEKVEHSL